MARTWDQIETIAGSELRERLIASGAIRPRTRPPWWIARPRQPNGEPVLEMDDAGREAAVRHIQEAAGRIIARPVMGLEGFLSSSRPRVVRRGRRCA